MAIGMDPRRRGLFGIPPVAAQPDMDGGLAEHSLAQATPPPPKSGGGTRHIVGILADALAGLAGQQGTYGPMMAQRRLLEAREAAQQRNAQQQRQWGNEDWMARQQWERDNPAPRVNDTVEDFNFIREQLGPEMGAKFLQNRADPPRYVQGPDGQFYPVQTAQAPTAPVGRLTPIEPTMQNTPAPQLGASGMPTTVTRAQYQTIVAAKGQQATDAWAARNNIQVGN
jgi:hypothetical protein